MCHLSLGYVGILWPLLPAVLLKPSLTSSHSNHDSTSQQTVSTASVNYPLLATQTSGAAANPAVCPPSTVVFRPVAPSYGHTQHL